MKFITVEKTLGRDDAISLVHGFRMMFPEVARRAEFGWRRDPSRERGALRTRDTAPRTSVRDVASRTEEQNATAGRWGRG